MEIDVVSKDSDRVSVVLRKNVIFCLTGYIQYVRLHLQQPNIV